MRNTAASNKINAFQVTYGLHRFLFGKTVAPYLSAPIINFALRNTAAALLALGIAMWMELDSPAWAPMTVWAVAQVSRGESLSKARWRLIGTILGVLGAMALIIAFPQQPWLFFPAIALWTGLCSGAATFVSNFRAYAMVLAGYTCAIVGIDAALHPMETFFIAVSRGTYITLGILCEAAMGLLFAGRQDTAARLLIRDKLQMAISSASLAVADLIEETPEALRDARRMFDTILRLSSDIEYAEIEMGPHGHEGDHARATLASVSLLLSRGVGFSARLVALDHRQTEFRPDAEPVRHFLRTLPARLKQGNATQPLLADIQSLIRYCLNIAEGRAQERQTPPVNERVLFLALAELLQDMDTALSEYAESQEARTGDTFRFRLETHRDPVRAVFNGLRVAAAVLSAALVWEVTAWPSGATFMTFATLTCGLFAATDNPARASLKFMWGVIWAAVAAAILVFVFLPVANTYELLIACLGPAMFLGAIARGNPRYTLQSVSYGLLMPSMLGLGNARRIDEIQFLNTSTATVLGAAAAVVIFQVVLPFSSDQERFRLRRQMLREMCALAARTQAPDARRWLGRNVDRLALLVRHAGENPGRVVDLYLRGALATITLGLNLIRLRRLMERGHLGEAEIRPIIVVLETLARTRDHYTAAIVATREALARLRHLVSEEPDQIARTEILRGISYLTLIAYELNKNPEFLDGRRQFTGHIDHLEPSAIPPQPAA